MAEALYSADLPPVVSREQGAVWRALDREGFPPTKAAVA
jgi:hypothetical protein